MTDYEEGDRPLSDDCAWLWTQVAAASVLYLWEETSDSFYTHFYDIREALGVEE